MSDYYELATELAAEIEKVKVLWGDDIVLGPEDYWRRLCDPAWVGPVPDKFLPYLDRYFERAVSDVRAALHLHY